MLAGWGSGFFRAAISLSAEVQDLRHQIELMAQRTEARVAASSTIAEGTLMRLASLERHVDELDNADRRRAEDMAEIRAILGAICRATSAPCPRERSR